MGPVFALQPRLFRHCGGPGKDGAGANPDPEQIRSWGAFGLGQRRGTYQLRRSALIAAGSILALGLGLGLDACSGGQGHKVIIDACLRSGQASGVCSCLAGESEKQLEKPMFNLVVEGAEGNSSEADRLLAGMTPAAQQKFADTTRSIARTCG